jgi:phage repressor protein C with HTH and peptisase S24 domain
MICTLQIIILVSLNEKYEIEIVSTEHVVQIGGPI